MTAVIFHSPFHALGSRRQTAASHRTADSFSEDRPLGWDPVARRAIGRAMEWPDSCPKRNCQPFCGFSFYFLIFCKCFMPSSKRLRKASTSSGVLSAQKDTRMAVSMASGSLPMAASVWLG